MSLYNLLNKFVKLAAGSSAGGKKTLKESLLDFGAKLQLIDLNSYPGTSFDVLTVQKLGKDLSFAAAALSIANRSQVLEILSNIMSETKDGGGQLYKDTQSLFNRLQVAKKKQTSVAPASPVKKEVLDMLKTVEVLLSEFKKAKATSFAEKANLFKEKYSTLKPEVDKMLEYLELSEASAISAKARGEVSAAQNLKQFSDIKNKFKQADAEFSAVDSGSSGKIREV